MHYASKNQFQMYTYCVLKSILDIFNWMCAICSCRGFTANKLLILQHIEHRRDSKWCAARSRRLQEGKAFMSSFPSSPELSSHSYSFGCLYINNTGVRLSKKENCNRYAYS